MEGGAEVDWQEVVFLERRRVSRQMVSGHGGGFDEGTVCR